MNSIITDHAQNRIKERSHTKGKKIAIDASKAWEKGKKIEDFSDKRIVKYLYNVLNASRELDRELRVLGNLIYIFNSYGTHLITVLNLPEKVKRQNHYGKNFSM